MRTAVIAAAGCCITLMNGCATRRGAGTGVAVGAGTMLAGLMVGAAMASSVEPGHEAWGAVFVGGGIIGVGGVITVGSLIDLVVLAAVGDRGDDAPREETDAVAVRRATATQRKAARALTQDAQRAARDGDCATVRSLDVQVRATDVTFHDTVFVGDEAIAACLAQPVAPTPAAPKPPPAGPPSADLGGPLQPACAGEPR